MRYNNNKVADDDWRDGGGDYTGLINQNYSFETPSYIISISLLALIFI